MDPVGTCHSEPVETGTGVWSSDAWFEWAVSWLDDRLAVAGRARTGPARRHRVRPWSVVLTAPTDAGPVWLKATAPGTAFEAGLYELLPGIAPDHVVAPIATDPDRGLLLLPHREPLRDADLVDVLPVYAEFQRAVAPHVDRVLAAGVADMRAPVMPERFAEARRVIGTSPELAGFADTFGAWCARLAESTVPPSLDHNDLHADNFLVGPRFYDWGDAVVAHPFASLLVPLQQVGPEERDRVRDAYLEVFDDLAPRADLVATAELACRVAVVARALVWHRAVSPEPGDYTDAPLATLRSLLG
ncbi:phosphotransferase family enzyme [Actinokineospora spheciospongiae]|nr:phosphotransferase family enzyme [Actinokineospora spheciospongiae]